MLSGGADVAITVDRYPARLTGTVRPIRGRAGQTAMGLVQE